MRNSQITSVKGVNTSLISGLLAVAVLLTCATVRADDREERENRLGGQILGGIVGGILGSQIGHGDGKVAATAAGTLIGAIMGGNIADKMSEDERRDSQKVMDEALRSNENDMHRTWHGPNYRIETDFDHRGFYDNRECRHYHSVTYDVYGRVVGQTDGFMCKSGTRWSPYYGSYRNFVSWEDYHRPRVSDPFNRFPRWEGRQYDRAREHCRRRYSNPFDINRCMELETRRR